MDKNKLHQQISKGTKAKLILEDPIVKEAFDYLFEQYRTEILIRITKTMNKDKYYGWHLIYLTK